MHSHSLMRAVGPMIAGLLSISCAVGEDDLSAESNVSEAQAALKLPPLRPIPRDPYFFVTAQRGAFARGSIRPTKSADILIADGWAYQLTDEGRVFGWINSSGQPQLAQTLDAYVSAPNRMLRDRFFASGPAFVVTAPSSTAVTLVHSFADASVRPSPVRSEVGVSPSDLTSGDFSNDGRSDLAILDDQGNVRIALSNGDGSFAPMPASYAVGALRSDRQVPRRIISADFNRDGHPDLAVAAPDNVVVLLGQGNGQFSAPTAISLPFTYALHVSNPVRLLSADLDRNGTMDLVIEGDAPSVGENWYPVVSVCLGDGNGTSFGHVTSFYPGHSGEKTSVRDLELGDVNGDGNLDIAVIAQVSNQSHVFTFAGFGGGGFGDLYDATPRYPDYDSSTSHNFLGMRVAAGHLFASKMDDLLILDDPARTDYRWWQYPTTYLLQVASWLSAR